MDIIPPSTMKTEEFRAVLCTVDTLEDHFLDTCGCIPCVSTITGTVALTIGIVGTICCVAVQVFQAIASYSGVATLFGIRIVAVQSDVQNLQYRFLNTLIKGCLEVAPFVGNIGVYVLVQDEIAQKKFLKEQHLLETALKSTSDDLQSERDQHTAYIQAETEKMGSFLETIETTQTKMSLLEQKCNQLERIVEETTAQKLDESPSLGEDPGVMRHSPPQGAVERYELPGSPLSPEAFGEDMSGGESRSSFSAPLSFQETTDLQHALEEMRSQLADQARKEETLRRQNEALRQQIDKERAETLLVLQATQNMISRQDLQMIQERMADHRRNSTRSHDPQPIR